MRSAPLQADEAIAERFRTIFISPPWTVTGQGQLERVPVMDLADADCHLHLLVSPQKLMDGLSLIDRWEFKYRTAITIARPGEGVPFAGGFLSDAVALLLLGIRGTVGLRPETSQQDDLVFAREGVDIVPAIRCIIERCSYPPFLQVFGDGAGAGWTFLDPA